MRFDRDNEELIDAAAERQFDVHEQLRRVRCPSCRVRGGLFFGEDEQHLRLFCKTPIARSADFESGRCDFELIYHATSTGDLPAPHFTAHDPPQKTSVRQRRRANP